MSKEEKDVTKIVVDIIDEYSAEAARKFFSRKAHKVVKSLEMQAAASDRRLDSCRVPFDSVPTGKNWYIHPNKIPQGWHTSIILDAQKAAEDKLHRKVFRGMTRLFKEETVQKLLHNSFVYKLTKKGVCHSLSHLSKAISGYDITLLPEVLAEYPGATSLANAGLQVAGTVGSELALSISLKEDIVRKYIKDKQNAGRLYGHDEIPARLRNSLAEHATEMTSRIVGAKYRYTYAPYAYITSEEINEFGTNTLELDPNFFMCPQADCGFDSNFTNACIDARQRQLYKMEQEFLQNYLMASSLESEKEAYPIYELVSHIRNDVLIDTPTVKDPLKDLIGDVTELEG